MRWALSLLEIVGFRRLVRIPGKTLASLTTADVAEMIFDFLDIGKGLFDKDAIYEFLEVEQEGELAPMKNRLLKIDRDCSSFEEPDGLSSNQGRAALREYADYLASLSNDTHEG